MKRYFYFLLFLFPVLLSAQTPKYALLDAANPLVGEWEWVKDPIGAPYSPVPDEQWLIIRFSAGTAQSMGALSYSEEKGYGCPSYFTAYSNGSLVTGTISDTCVSSDKGKKFSFAYSFDGVELIITVGEETFHYKRRN